MRKKLTKSEMMETVAPHFDADRAPHQLATAAAALREIDGNTLSLRDALLSTPGEVARNYVATVAAIDECYGLLDTLETNLRDILQSEVIFYREYVATIETLCAQNVAE